MGTDCAVQMHVVTTAGVFRVTNNTDEITPRDYKFNFKNVITGHAVGGS